MNIYENNEGDYMEIKLESNRKFLFKIFIPLIVLFSIAIIGLIISCIIDKLTIGDLIVIIIFAIMDAIYVLSLIIICKKRKPQYTFSMDKIVYTKRNEERQMEVCNIKSMTYMRMKWYIWFLALFVALLGDGSGFSFPVIKVVEEDGTEHELGFFSKKEIEILKNIYGSMLDE